MKKSTIRKIKAEADNKEELLAYGYKIQELEPWHWRLTRPDYDVTVDVWPTSKKVWIVGSYKKAEVYQDLFKKITEIFDQYMP